MQHITYFEGYPSSFPIVLIGIFFSISVHLESSKCCSDNTLKYILNIFLFTSELIDVKNQLIPDQVI